MNLKSLLKSWQFRKKPQLTAEQNYSSQYMGVIFADIVDSSKLIKVNNTFQGTNLERVTKLFSSFDKLILPFGGVRIKTNGDQYIAVVRPKYKKTKFSQNKNISSNKNIIHLFKRRSIQSSVNAGILEALDNSPNLALKTFNACKSIINNSSFDIKIGASFGKVTIGVFDPQYPQVDIWGTPVLIAARLEAIADTKELAIDQSFYNQLGYHKDVFKTTQQHLKGLGKTKVYIKAFDDNYLMDKKPISENY